MLLVDDNTEPPRRGCPDQQGRKRPVGHRPRNRITHLIKSIDDSSRYTTIVPIKNLTEPVLLIKLMRFLLLGYAL